MRFDIRNYFKTGKTPYTAQFSEDFSAENFDGSVIREPVTGSFQAVPTADGVVMQLTIAAETDAECARCLTPIHQSYNFSVDYFVKERELDDPDFELPLDEKGCLDIRELVYQELIFKFRGYFYVAPIVKAYAPSVAKGRRQDVTANRQTKLPLQMPGLAY